MKSLLRTKTWTACLFLLLGAVAGAQAIRLPNVPREELLIVDNLAGRISNPAVFNPYQAGTILHQGLHNLALDSLWDINTVTGEWFNVLAAAPPEPLGDDYTEWRITLREGITWSDGEPFTAEDVVFTFDMLTTNEELPAYGFWSDLIERAEAEGDYAVKLTLTRPYAKLQTLLGVVVYGNGFRPIPKHIWEGEDPATFDFYPPVGVGPYTLESVDPSGYWFLWKRRDDWQQSTVGVVAGEPKPRYVLFVAYGPEERRVLAGAQHQLDVFTDITPESWDVLRARNPNAQTFDPNFPWAWMDDPCERGMTFNLQNEPYNLKEVRWALTLATNIEEVSLATFSGMLRMSPLHIPPINVFRDDYFGALEPWLRDFALEDGYKPFDPEVAVRMAERLAAQGREVPTDPAEAKELFGIGWWKFDPAQATKLLESVGFTQQGGRWLLPGGSPWTITLVAPSNFEIQSSRLAFAVADQWRSFGVEVNVQAVESGQFWTMWPTGEYDVGSYWPGCGQIPDIWSFVNGFHKRYLAPTGEAPAANVIRWENDEVSRLAEEMEGLLPTDPEVVELGREALKVFVEEMPYIPMVGTSKFVPVDTTYWTNWPSADNHYDNPVWWWSGFKFILPHIEPTNQTGQR
jgi:peptide/nickel transport system substrate-binding protein